MNIIFILLFSQLSFANDFSSEAPKAAAKLKQDLMGSLQREIAKNGPIGALDFCHLHAQDITKKTAKDLNNDFQVGRTSHKVRNSINAPEAWIRPYLDKFKDKKMSDENLKAFTHKTKNGQIFYVEPLWTAPMCLQCHGESIAKDVSDEISKRYPNDQARGFKANEFRGFIWVKSYLKK